MKKFSVLIFVMSLLFLLACKSDQTTDGIEETALVSEPENIAYTTFGEFNDGDLVDSVYSNTFFGIEIPILDGWNIIRLNNHLYQDNEDVKVKDTLSDPSENNYFQLITLQMHDRIPLVNFIVEKIEPIPNVSNAKEYLNYTEQYILEGHQTGYPRYISHAVIESPVGGRPFLNQTFTVEFENTSQFQRNYCVQFDHYIFTIITHYGNQADLDVINELLAQITWNNPH